MADNNDRGGGPSFHGEEGEDYPTWKAQMQLILMLKAEDTHMLYLIQHVKGKASQTLVAGGVAGLTTTKAIFEKLETRYGNSIDTALNLSKAKRCYQGTKTVETYSGEMSGYLTQTGFAQTEQANMYISGLRRDLQAIVMTMEPANLGEAIRMASRFEPLFPVSKPTTQITGRGGSIEGGNRPPRDMSTVKCYKCKKMGHYKRDCRGEKAQGAEAQGEPRIAEIQGNEVAH